jgi:hypothetical protein
VNAAKSSPTKPSLRPLYTTTGAELSSPSTAEFVSELHALPTSASATTATIPFVPRETLLMLSPSFEYTPDG